MSLNPLLIATQGLFPLTPIAAAVQGFIALLQEEELDRLKRYKEMGLGYARRQSAKPPRKRRKLSPKQRAEAIIADDEEVLLVLSAALEMME